MKTKPLVLVACCGPKLGHAAPAKDIYTSDLFRKSRAYAQRHGSEWLILSAKHGVLDPETVIEPYDARVPQGKKQRLDFARHIAIQLHEHRARDIIVLAGEDYCGFLHALDRQWFDGQWHVSAPVFPHARRPMKGMGIGQMKQWLAQQLEVQQ